MNGWDGERRLGPGGVSYPNESSSSFKFPIAPAVNGEGRGLGALRAAADRVNKLIMTSSALSLGSMDKLSFFNFGVLKQSTS